MSRTYRSEKRTHSPRPKNHKRDRQFAILDQIHEELLNDSKEKCDGEDLQMHAFCLNFKD